MEEVTLFIHHEYVFILLLRPLTSKKQNEGIHRVPPLHLQVHHLILHSLSSSVEVPLLYSKCAFGAVKENITFINLLSESCLRRNHIHLKVSYSRLQPTS